MTGLYVASNVQSLVSQTQLQHNMTALGDILTRLSTGLRINSGKDDPAGLIASELLKSDITGSSMAIRNTQRANSVIAIADSALGQVSNLLNDIRGLVVEAANTGAMSAEQIAANQLQVDASLDSIDRISKTTNFQGELLLDGSLDFETQGVDRSAIPDLNIYQANFGTQSKIDVSVNILKDASAAKLFYDKGGVSVQTILEVTGNLGNDVFKFEAGTSVDQMARAINLVSDSTGVSAVVGAEATNGQIMLTSAGLDNDINLIALATGTDAGNYTVKFSAGNSEETTYTLTPPHNGEPGIIDFKLKMQETTAPSALDLDEKFNGIHTYDISGADDGSGIVVETTNGEVLKQVEFYQTDLDSVQYPGGVAATYDKARGLLQIHHDGSATDVEIKRAIESIDGFKYIAGDTMPDDGYYDPFDLRANNGINIEAAIPGSKFENTDVIYVKDKTVDDLSDGTEKVGDIALAYSDGAQRAAATIKWGDGTTTDPTADPPEFDVQMRIVAKQIGAAMNDVKIEFEQDDTFAAGKVTATYDAKNKILHVRGQVDNQTDETLNASYGDLKSAIEDCSPFSVDVTTLQIDDSTSPPTPGSYNGKPYSLSQRIRTGLVSDDATGVTPNVSESSYIRTGQVYGDIGTDHQALFVRIGGADDYEATADDVVKAFNDTVDAPFAQIAANFKVSTAGNGTGQIFGNADVDELDADVMVRSYSAALTGGNDGWTTNVTAKELVDFINSDETLSTLFRADMARGQNGAGLLTLFDEAAYYGSSWEDNSLQFLGPKGSPDVMFVTDGPNSALSISFMSGTDTNACVSDTRPAASMLATNPNAAFAVQALTSGEQFDNMAVRLIRLDKNHVVDDTAEPPRDDSYAQYISGPSTAMAYCSINDANSGTLEETGKFIVYSAKGGDELNNVSVIAKLDENQSERVKVNYDETRKQLVISVNSKESDPDLGAVTLTEAVAAINQTGLFRAEYDFSYNNRDDDTGPGLETFGPLLAAKTTSEIGNTGNTGGYNGVLEVYVAGDDSQITSQRVVDAINKNAVTSKLFSANLMYNGDDLEEVGLIDFRKDNLRTIVNSDGSTSTEPNIVTGISGTTGTDTGYMVVHLATDQYGNAITTAKDLVNYMNTLTADETHGISVSLIRPDGVDNLNRHWTVDSCGNVVETQDCDDDYGKGLLKPTIAYDDCDNPIYSPIEFWSYGENMTDGYAHGTIVAANGVNASMQIYAKQAGSDYNGTSFKYVLLTDPLKEMYTEYDTAKKQIVAYIQPSTSAAAVKNLIESSDGTKDLFRAVLTGDGSGIVTPQDDYMVMKGGVYDAGYRGGAHMLGATDSDPHRLVFESTEQGSTQKVIVRTLEGDFTVKTADGITADTAYGSDMVANLNGISMKGDGRKISLDSSTLKLDMTVADKVTTGDTIQFSITGGGATFQIGADVVSNQQIRVGIQSVNSARLGGVDGRLYQLRSGNNADLSTDTKLADRIVQDAILSIAQTRGRLGAIQRSTLDPAIITLQDTVEQLSAAEAQISNADFAEESSRLTRAQILVQSGAKTLAIANQFPQYAASLIG